MRKEAIPDLEEAHRLLQPVYSCLRRAERLAHEVASADQAPEGDASAGADGIRTVMDRLDSAKEELETLMRPSRH
jgi:hypothetical protein